MVIQKWKSVNIMNGNVKMALVFPKLITVMVQKIMVIILIIKPTAQMDLMKLSFNVVNLKEMTLICGIHMTKNSVLIQLMEPVVISNLHVGMVLVFLWIITVMVLRIEVMM